MKSPSPIAAVARPLGGTSRFWIGLIVLVPVIPKAATFHLAGTSILLDDLVLTCALFLGLADLLSCSIVRGQGGFIVSRTSILIILLVSYKIIAFLSLSLVFPWGDLSRRGYGLLFDEGCLVLARKVTIAGVYLLFYHFLRSLEDIYFVLRLYFLIVLVVVIISLFQYFALDHNTMTATFRNVHAIGQNSWKLENPWIDGTSTGHEHLGAFMVLALSILGGCLLYRWPAEPGYRKTAFIIFAVGIFVLLMASSRGAWVGALCAGAAFAWLAVRRRRFASLNRLFLLLGVGFGILYITEFDFASNIVRRVDRLHTVLDDEVLDDSANHRLGLLKYLWAMFLDQPLLGWGAGGAGRIAEGQYIRELVEGGVIGGGLFLTLILITAKIAARACRIARTPLTQGLSLGFLCGLVGIMGQSLFTELFILPKVIVPFWVLAAIVHRIYFLERPISGGRL